MIQNLKFNETDRYTTSPQTRFSFMGTLNYDVTDKLHFNASGRFAQSKTQTYLGRNTLTNGWEATIPYNARTDSPIDPALTLTQPIITQILNAPGGVVPAAYANPNFIAHGAKGAQHPVTPALAMLLNNRTATAAQAASGMPTCPVGATTNCYNPLTAGWITEVYEYNGFDQRRTDNVLSNWTVDASLKLDLPVKDWTAELYYSRGESVTSGKTYGSVSLERWRRVVTSADYGYNSTFRSNANGNNPGFNSVATPCTTGFYDTLFNSGAAPSADCLYAVEAVLQVSTTTQQDVVEANFEGGLFNTWAGEVRGAAGYQFRRNATRFTPDILQSSASYQRSGSRHISHRLHGRRSPMAQGLLCGGAGPAPRDSLPQEGGVGDGRSTLRVQPDRQHLDVEGIGQRPDHRLDPVSRRLQPRHACAEPR